MFSVQNEIMFWIGIQLLFGLAAGYVLLCLAIIAFTLVLFFLKIGGQALFASRPPRKDRLPVWYS